MMRQVYRSDRIAQIRCDIRGPILTEALKLEAQGIPVVHLNTGNPAKFGFSCPEPVLEQLRENINNSQAYCDAKGLLPSREAIAAYSAKKGIKGVTPNDIYITNGVSEAAETCLLALLNTGDEILLPCPDYTLWTGSTLLSGGTPVYYTCDESSEWMPDVEDIKQKITPRTRAIVIINPNNPTGAVYPKAVLEQIIQLAREHNLIIFSDEIYDQLVLGDEVQHIATASLADDVFMVTFGGLSKSHYLCGFRVGWAVFSGPTADASDFIDGINVLTSMRLCSNVPVQHVIPAALENSEDIRRMFTPGGRFYEQCKVVQDELVKIPGISVVPNKATFYMFPKLDAQRFNITNDEQFAIDFLRAKHVMIVNGRGFHWGEPNHFRIICLPEAEQLRQTIRDLGDFLSDYHQA